MVKQLKSLIIGCQNLVIFCIVVFLTWDATTQNYTSFTSSPPNTADKTWYFGEAVIWLLIGILLVVLNIALHKCFEDFSGIYIIIWKTISFNFLIRFIWTIIWVTFGLSANMTIAQTILFGAIFGSGFFITFLPYLKKILNGTK